MLFEGAPKRETEKGGPKEPEKPPPPPAGKQQTMFHGLKDLPGQGDLFNLDVGGEGEAVGGTKNVWPAEDVLEGYESLEDAEEDYQTFRDREVVRYTAAGLEVTPERLKKAIEQARGDRALQAKLWPQKPSPLSSQFSRAIAEHGKRAAESYRSGLVQLLDSHNERELDTAARRAEVEAAGFKWRDYKALRYAEGTEAHQRSVLQGHIHRAAEADRLAAESAAQKAAAQERRSAKKAADKAAAEKAAQERIARIAKQMEADRNVEPHWPTYRKVIQLGPVWAEWRDAARYGDMGDYVAFKTQAEEFEDLVVKHLDDIGELATDVWTTIR